MFLWRLTNLDSFINPRRACARVTVLGLCVCLSVCVSGTTSPVTTRNGASNRRYLRHWRNLENGVFSKNALFKSYGVKKANKLISMWLPRHFCDILWRRWSDILQEISKTGPFLVLSKSNGRLQATWNNKAASY